MSWDATDWNQWNSFYCDRLNAPSTMEQPYDAFTGRAQIFPSIESTQPFPIDLIIESVDFAFDEHTQVEQHIGNGFSFIAFGKNAMELRANGVLVDTGKNYGKDSFMDVYRNYLRLEAVARRGVCPIFTFPNAAMYCAAMNVSFAETATSEDLVYITLTLAVMKAVFKSEDNNLMLDYVHGIEMSDESVLNTTLQLQDTVTGPTVVSKEQATSMSNGKV